MIAHIEREIIRITAPDTGLPDQNMRLLGGMRDSALLGRVQRGHGGQGRGRLAGGQARREPRGDLFGPLAVQRPDDHDAGVPRHIIAPVKVDNIRAFDRPDRRLRADAGAGVGMRPVSRGHISVLCERAR